MPSVTVENPLALPRLEAPAADARPRPVDRVVTAQQTFEGAGFPVSRPSPITCAHASVSPGARLTVPWLPECSAMAYVLTGRGEAGDERRPIDARQLVMFGPGDSLVVSAADDQPEDSPNLEVLLLGGLPIREPIAHYGPFLMNTRAEIRQAMEDFNAGRMGRVPVGGA